MKILNLLRKLGVVRYGVKEATFTSGKDRPVEFMMDGVYNAEKDLMTKKDLDGMTHEAPAVSPALTVCGKCGVAVKPDWKFCTACGAPVVMPKAAGCVRCGAVLKAGARFCAACGSPAATVAAPPALPGAPAAGKSWVLPMVMVLVGVTGFLILIMMVSTSRKKGDAGGAVSERIESVVAPVGKEIGTAISRMADDVSKEAADAGAEIKPAVVAKAPPPVVEASPSASGTPRMKYDTYANKKFGFVTELPAHWESQVKDNAHVFCGTKGAEDYDTTVNFQFINKDGRSIRNQADEIIGQWKAMDDFDLDEIKQGELGGCEMLTMVAHFSLPSGREFRQKQVIIGRGPYYYMIAYTAPGGLFAKYAFVMDHVMETFRFTDMEAAGK